jgi:hypothetical protein
LNGIPNPIFQCRLDSRNISCGFFYVLGHHLGMVFRFDKLFANALGDANGALAFGSGVHGTLLGFGFDGH